MKTDARVAAKVMKNHFTRPEQRPGFATAAKTAARFVLRVLDVDQDEAAHVADLATEKL